MGTGYINVRHILPNCLSASGGEGGLKLIVDIEELNEINYRNIKLKIILYDDKGEKVEERFLSEEAKSSAFMNIANDGMAYEFLPTSFIESLGIAEGEKEAFFEVAYYLWNSCGLEFCNTWEAVYLFVKMLVEKYSLGDLVAIKEDIRNTFNYQLKTKKEVELQVGKLYRDWISKQKKKMFTRAGVNKDLRKLILERDNYTCQICGSKEELTIDHIIPFSKGGSNHPDNLQTLCKTCNIKKHAKF